MVIGSGCQLLALYSARNFVKSLGVLDIVPLSSLSKAGLFASLPTVSSYGYGAHTRNVYIRTAKQPGGTKMPKGERTSSLTSAQFRRKLHQAGLNQRRFAIWVQMDVGTINRWATDRAPAPHWVRLLLDLLIEQQGRTDR